MTIVQFGGVQEEYYRHKEWKFHSKLKISTVLKMISEIGNSARDHLFFYLFNLYTIILFQIIFQISKFNVCIKINLISFLNQSAYAALSHREHQSPKFRSTLLNHQYINHFGLVRPSGICSNFSLNRLGITSSVVLSSAAAPVGEMNSVQLCCTGVCLQNVWIPSVHSSKIRLQTVPMIYPLSHPGKVYCVIR